MVVGNIGGCNTVAEIDILHLQPALMLYSECGVQSDAMRGRFRRGRLEKKVEDVCVCVEWGKEVQFAAYRAIQLHERIFWFPFWIQSEIQIYKMHQLHY